jgi:phosphate transport system protein
MPSHTDKAFEQDLETVRQLLLTMAAKVQSLIDLSVKALVDGEASTAEVVAKGDQEVNRLEVDIDELCRKILALRQPAASDLRLITTALKIVTDLERCGDLAVNISERAHDLIGAPPMAAYQDVTRLATVAQQQLGAALASFVAADPDKAQEVLKGDEMLDALFLKLFNDLLALMMEDSKYIRRATGLIFVGKALERIGDHAMNIAEMVVYMVKGQDIRHPHSRRLAWIPK